jgi:manganese transport protein
VQEQVCNYFNHGQVGRKADQPVSRTSTCLLSRRRRPIPGWFKLIGPGLVISIGYVDPGNWATDLAAGAYGYRLLWVLIVAGALALLLQCAVARLGLASGVNLAVAIAERWKRGAPALGLVFAAAIVATDLAEFAGIAVGLQLIFGLPLAIAALVGLLGVMLVFILNAGSLRRLERTLIALLWLVAVAMVFQVRALYLPFEQIGTGLILPALPDHSAILVAIGIVGATVMPHNLFLHSSIIVGNCQHLSANARRQRNHFYASETFWALLLATLINIAIVIVAVANRATGTSFTEAYAQIHHHSGAFAALMFGGALAVAGLAASVTATWSADYVVSAFSPVRISPVMRRAATAIPACALMAWASIRLN